ncbi:MAG TPA: DUF1697 domain-containing protein [Pyrinomonadaceae bacterium]|nr:DUF1697 domain-containing protein [Pyrinomonadaceae bacterium]
MTKYVALLRKINVGGQNVIKMDALREAFEAAGLKNVRTFQQAGNVVFETTAKNPVAKIERVLSVSFDSDLKAIVFSLDELANIAKRNPFERVEQGDVMLCVAFLADKPAQTPKLPLKSTTENLEMISVRDRAAFVVARRKKSGWFGFPNNFVEKELGVTATTRQWSTLRKLIDFAERLF